MLSGEKLLRNLSQDKSVAWHILCVDDDRDSCELIVFMLNDSDSRYRVTIARTVAEAIALVTSQQFDLILLDQRYPDGTGVELCTRIRQLNSKIPIVFYTADVFEATQQAALAAGAQVYLTKPNGLTSLVETIGQQIASYHLEQSLEQFTDQI